jgi:hypothetical protein
MPGSPQDVRIQPDTLRSIDSATFTGSYQKLGAVLAQNARLIKFTNNSNKDATISWNGINDHDFIPAGSFLLIDVAANAENAWQFDVPAQTQFFIKGAAGVGLVYLSVYFAN